VTPTIVRHDGPAGRFYEVPTDPNPQRADGLYGSVTHILDGGYPKPALQWWAASEERKLVSAAAADLFEAFATELVPPVMPRAAYLATLKEQLGPTKAHQKLLAKAGDIGTQAHDMIAWILRTAIGAVAGPKPVIADAAQWSVFAFEDWAKSVNFKPVLCERTVYSKVHGFAGTLDVLGRVNGVMTEISVKTSKGIYPDNFLQSAAYVTALVERGYLPPDGGSLILRLPKNVDDPAFEVVPAPPAAELLPTFLAVKQVWEFTYAADQAYRARTAKRTKVA
jgi:hypothetical protein